MSKYSLGCCVPGASFMPEGVAGVKKDVLSELVAGVNVILRAGFDFAEVGVGMVMKLTEEEFNVLAKMKLPIRAANSFIPSEYKIVAEDADSPDGGLYRYVDKALSRLSRLGAETVVFGSGGARRIPDGMTRAEGCEYIKKFLVMCNELGERYGVTVAIEPLRASECNAVNLTEDGARISKEVCRPRIKYLADAFHMAWGGEAPDVLSSHHELPVHIHVSEAPDRTYPGSVDGKYLTEFAKALKNTDYSGRISVECGFSDFDKEVALAYNFVKNRF